MKKIKILLSTIMIVVCFAVLGLGIYAAKPTSRNINTTITISAAGIICELTAYKEGSPDPISNTVKVRDSAEEIVIRDGELHFASGYFAEELDPIILKIGIKNTSGIKLGAYFAKSATDSGQDNIETPRYLSGTTSTGTVPEAVYLEFGEYTEVPIGETAYITCTITAKELAAEAMTIDLDLILIVEEAP